MKKLLRNRLQAFLLTTTMILSLMLSPLGGLNVLAEEDLIPNDAPTLVYGDPSLPDEDAFVLFVFGDGFTAEEQDKFYEESEKIADYVMATSPWDEFTDAVKIYALGTISKESGARADNATTQAEADADTRDTYFGTTFWSSGMQRLLSVGRDGRNKINALEEEYLPHTDYSVIIVNSSTYGGSGGSVCVASLNESSLEMMLHELGHTTSNLADEYFAGVSYAREYANMTAESDPEKVKWSRFIGKNGVGVYEYGDGGEGWYRPHQACKMQYLGKEYAFCEVCKEEIRRTFCQDCNVTKLFFQPYADTFYEAETGKDMREYFIIRDNGNEATGDTLGNALTLVYKDADGNVVNGIPSKAGTYTIEASFAGNDTYDACTQTATYTIELPDLITLNVESKVYDGAPAALDYTVDYDKEYTVKAQYTGSIPYASGVTNTYDSEEAPINPGSYKVTLTAYDKETGNVISTKATSYEIKFKTTTLVNNNSNDYPGAAVYYNNQTVAITGEGFTAEEQDEFEALAKQLVDHLQNTEPLKETQLYFNFSSVEAGSNTSGIGTTAGDTYFKTSLDENGKIVPNADGTAAAKYIGYYLVTAYYKATIVIVNDSDATESAVDGNAIYITPDEAGMDYAAYELVNKLTNKDPGYRAETEEEIAAQRTDLLSKLYYQWYGTDYALITSRAYDETFVEDGTAFDLAPYFHTYVKGIEVPDAVYTLTYYADNNGEVGEALEAAPSEAGTYHVKAELIPADGGWSQEYVVDGVSYYIPLARGWTTYTIEAVQEEEPDVDNPDIDVTPGEDDNVDVDTDDNADEKDNENTAASTGDSASAMSLILLMISTFAAIAYFTKRKYA